MATKKQIVPAYMLLSLQHGYANVSTTQIARLSKGSQPLINYHYQSKAALTKAMFKRALEEECYPIIAQGWVFNDRLLTEVIVEAGPKSLETVKQAIGYVMP